jgi:FKBP-type peptidyl-prolyl cis-trans isomerase FkpA
MAEVTRVPLQPLKKGSLSKLWFGIFAVILAGAALAWFTVPKGVTITTLVAGMGNSPTAEDVVFVKYTGKLEDGTVFDQGQEFPVPVPGIFPEGTPMPLTNLIPGFRDGLMRMQKGGKYTLYIPSDKAYGPQGSIDPATGLHKIPPNADLVFEIELIDFMSRPDLDRRIEMVQQAMQAQQAAPGGQGGEGGAEAPGDAPPIAEPTVQ